MSKRISLCSATECDKCDCFCLFLAESMQYFGNCYGNECPTVGTRSQGRSDRAKPTSNPGYQSIVFNLSDVGRDNPPLMVYCLPFMGEGQHFAYLVLGYLGVYRYARCASLFFKESRGLTKINLSPFCH